MSIRVSIWLWVASIAIIAAAGTGGTSRGRVILALVALAMACKNIATQYGRDR